MPRTIVLLLDSFGIGASLDANQYGDAGADTFGHIVKQCPTLHIPNLCQRGLHLAHLASTGKRLDNFIYTLEPQAHYGYACELSHGKDTPSGHWEIAGVPVLFEWGYFPPDCPSVPEKLTQALIKRATLPGFLGNKHASGTAIIHELGAEHITTGKPILYTSADSVLQIAAHEKHFGLEKLYQLCAIARELVNDYNIGRVIARPFSGTTGNFTRTANRKDLSVPPPQATLLEKIKDTGGQVIAIGKTADIFAHQGINQSIKAAGNMALFDATLIALQQTDPKEKNLIFTNFVDFDSQYGHRRDVVGYARALEDLDARLPELDVRLQPDDLVIITADHGCDPTWPGSDHTREHIPILAYGTAISSKFIGRRDTFADIGQSIATHLGLAPLDYGNSFLLPES